MSLKIRRGLELNLPASPDDGELLYATDSNKLFVGFGGSANEISGGTGGGLGNVVEDTTPQLGGNLDVNGSSIVSTNNGDITIFPDGAGNIQLLGNINTTGNISKTGELNISTSGLTSFGNDAGLVDANLYITRNSYSSAFAQGLTFAQHHSTADAVNFTFYRTRGTGLSPSVIQYDDILGDLAFVGWDGTARRTTATIRSSVDVGAFAGGIPGRIQFLINDGNGPNLLRRAELRADGTFRVNIINALALDGDLTLKSNGIGSVVVNNNLEITSAGNLQLNAQGELRFTDSDNSNYVAFQAPTTVSNNVTWTLPGSDGSGGQVLSTNGAGTLAWETITAIPSRIELSGETETLADTQAGNTAITGFKGYALYKIQVNHAAWVRIYTDVAARDADASRTEGDDPLPGAGVIAEIITTSADTIFLTPGVIGFNNESPVTNIIPIAVTNKSGSSTTITVTLTILQIEA
jgi:hypothetical protein